MTASKFYATILALNNIDDETRAFAEHARDKAVATEAKDLEKKLAKKEADMILVNTMIDALKEAGEPMTTSDVAAALQCHPSKVTALYNGYLSDDPHIERTEVRGAKNMLVKAYIYKA